MLESCVRKLSGPTQLSTKLFAQGNSIPQLFVYWIMQEGNGFWFYVLVLCNV